MKIELRGNLLEGKYITLELYSTDLRLQKFPQDQSTDAEVVKYVS